MANLNARVVGPHTDVVASRTPRIKIHQRGRIDEPAPQRLVTTTQRAPPVQDRPALLLHLDQSWPVGIKRHRRERLPTPAVLGDRGQHRNRLGAGPTERIDPRHEVEQIRLDTGLVDVDGYAKIATQLPHGQQQIVCAAQRVGRFGQCLAQDGLGADDEGGPRPDRRLRHSQLRLLVEIFTYRPHTERRTASWNEPRMVTAEPARPEPGDRIDDEA